MITDSLLGFFFDFVNGLLDKLPLMHISVDLSMLNGFLDILAGVLYFFPWAKVAPILGIIIMMQTWRIIVSIIKTIWNLLPFL